MQHFHRYRVICAAFNPKNIDQRLRERGGGGGGGGVGVGVGGFDEVISGCNEEEQRVTSAFVPTPLDECHQEDVVFVQSLEYT